MSKPADEMPEMLDETQIRDLLSAGGDDQEMFEPGFEEEEVEETPAPAEPEEVAETPEKEKEGSENKGAPEQEVEEKGEEPPQPPAAAAPPSDDLSEIRRQLAQVTQELARTQGELSAVRAPKEAPKEEERVFNIGVPPKLVEDLGSEDPNARAAAVHFLVNNLAELTYKQTMRDVMAKVEPLVSARVQGTIQASTVESDISRDFYGAFPELNKKQLAPIVFNVAKEVVSEFGDSWNPRMRDEIGRRVKALLAEVGGHVSPSTQQQTQNTQQQQRKVPIRPANRSRPGAVTQAKQTDIGDLLGI